MATPTSKDRLYFRQLLSGRDFAAGDIVATQMRNFAYLIGDRRDGRLRWWSILLMRPRIWWTRWKPMACGFPACW